MDDTQKTTSIIDSQSEQESYKLVAKLLLEVKNIIKSIEDSDARRKQKMSQLNKEIDDGISEVEKLCSDLDEIEQAAGIELDKMILNQIQDLSSDEE